MSGLILLFILCAWGFASYSLAKFIAQPIQNISLKAGVNIALLILIFIAPIADDIVGGFQFRKMCNENARFVINIEKGKEVYLEDIPDENISNLLIPIRKQTWLYKDTDTEDVLISWNDFYAKGGWLSRAIGFPEGSPPYTFNGSCIVKNGHDFDFEKHNIKKKQRR